MTLVWVVCLVSCMVNRWETLLLHLSFSYVASSWQGWSCSLVEGFLISIEDFLTLTSAEDFLSLIAASGFVTSYLGS